MKSDSNKPSVEIVQCISQQLADVGYCILDSALPEKLCQDLYQRVCTLASEEFSRAGIGRNTDFHLDHAYRTDKIHWLDQLNSAEAAYLEWMEQLRSGVNRQLFMGLFDYESHFAHYAPGTFYKRHLDAFKGNTNRVLTTVLYLNPEWHKENGGEILLYENESKQTPFKSVSPEMGRLVIFLSDQFPHEVIKATKDRYSIAGWFKVKPPIGVL